MRHLLLLGLATVGLVGVAVAQSPARTPAQLIQNRQAGYKQIAAAFRAVQTQARAANPDLALIRSNSAIIARLAPSVSGWFPRGTGPEAGVRTRAKAEIWAQPREFRTAAVNLVVAARRLQSVSRGSNVPAIQAAARSLGESCSACHNTFRVPED